MSDQRISSRSRARDAAKALTDAVNEMGFDVDAFADEILRSHRTLQQNAFGAFLCVIHAWANLDSTTSDLRNEWTVEKSREIVGKLGEYNLKPPMI